MILSKNCQETVSQVAVAIKRGIRAAATQSTDVKDYGDYKRLQALQHIHREDVVKKLRHWCSVVEHEKSETEHDKYCVCLLSHLADKLEPIK